MTVGRATAAAGCSSCGQAGAGALDGQGLLGLGHGGQDEQHDSAGDRVGGVQSPAQDPQADAAACEVVDELDDSDADPPEPVQCGDGDDVAGGRGR